MKQQHHEHVDADQAAHDPTAGTLTQPLRVAEEKTGWHRTNIAMMLSMHALALLAVVPAFFHWSGVVLVPVMFYLGAGLGICLGYHRLLTHRSFETPKAIEYLLAMLGTLSMQGSPTQWVGTHRIHHKESDGPHDPHSPQHGFTWSHILWCFYRHPDGHDPLDFTRDLQRDRGMMIIDRYFFIPQLVVSIILFALGWLILGPTLGGWQGGMCWLVWGVGVRTVVTFHATWFVNSAAHTWGYRNFDTDDGSRNNWWVALISFGEGWHNNHHAQQRSAAHGMRRWEIDPTFWVILLMEKVGLARRVVRPKLPTANTIDAAAK
ncbi:MAG: acyl-CoA desaturase [Phycisphaerales bacterium]